jgi:ribosome-binding protein aMBF1 (putative translation factor)
MRKVNDLTNWVDYEKKLLMRPKFKKLAQDEEHKYQLVRSLINARLKKKMSQEELARRIGTKQPVISRLENMQSHPTLTLLQKIGNALDTKLHIYYR